MSRPLPVAWLLATVLAAAGATAHAEPVTLRMAAIAPEGTEWARALRAFARDVETSSHGEIKMKWYLGGIAGDELTALERVKHGQLDGEAGANFCQRLAPSLRAARLPGLYNNREELIYVLGRLKPTFDEEFRKSGFVGLGQALFGSDVLFSREPITSWEELKKLRVWSWNLDPVWQMSAEAMGFKAVVVSTIEEHSALWRRKQYDAYFTVPTVALAYQWSTEATYFSDLAATMLPACMVIANSAIDPLPIELRQTLITSSARFMKRFDEISAQLEGELAGGLFAHQGLKRVVTPPEMRAQFQAAAKASRDKLGAALIAPALLANIEKILAEYRAAHRPGEAATR